MKLFNNYPFSLEIHFVKPDLNFTSWWKNFIIVKTETTGSMKRLRTVVLCTSVGTCQHHSWSMAQPEIGVTQGHTCLRPCKYRCNLGLMLCLNSQQVCGLRNKIEALKLESICPQSAMPSDILCGSGLPRSLGLVVPIQILSWLHPPALV